MPDMTMCNDLQCPVAEHCRRSPMSGTMPDPVRQSYFLSSPRSESQGCPYFQPETIDGFVHHLLSPLKD